VRAGTASLGCRRHSTDERFQRVAWSEPAIATATFQSARTKLSSLVVEAVTPECRRRSAYAAERFCIASRPPWYRRDVCLGTNGAMICPPAGKSRLSRTTEFERENVTRDPASQAAVVARRLRA
jgi:hypothetical protein